MSRYIDADALKYYGNHIGDEYEDYFHETQWVYRSQIDTAPSIDIVKCAECRRVREDGGHANCGGYLYCRKWKTLVDEDSYCSWGEREGE